MTAFDAIVVGGGHNGLVAATVLAKSGRKVLVLEAAEAVGGAARSHAFAPGCALSMPHVLNRLHPDVIRILDLEKHGLDLSGEPAPTVVLSRNGAPLVLRGGYGEFLEGASPAESAAWAPLRAQLLRHSGILKPFLARRPPDLAGGTLPEKLALGSAALSLRRLGKEDMRDFLRMILMNVADVVDEHLTDDRLKGLLAFDAVLGSQLGPRSPTSLLGLYFRLTGELAGSPGAQLVPKGGMAKVVEAIERAAEKAGVLVRFNASVARILVEKGRATGVELATGEIVSAQTIVSAINPKTTLLDLVGPRHLDAGFVRRVGHIRMKGNVAKLHLALDRPPRFEGVSEADLGGRLVIAPSVDHVENAFNPSKYGELSASPVMEIVAPGREHALPAHDGTFLLSASIPFVPYDIRQGRESGQRKLMDTVLDTIETYAPGLKASVSHSELLTPADIETRFLMPGGHWHHGELQADQMLVNRPLFGASGYAVPIKGLFLAGAGSHPGGGISGAPGLNAARHILEGR